MSLLDKFSNGLTVMVVQILYDKYANHAPVEFYRNVLSFVCGGATIMALLALLSLARDEIGARKTVSRRKKTLEDDEREPLLTEPTINGGLHGSIVPVQS